jgi:hypothetical protein
MPLYFFNFSREPELNSPPFKNEGLELVDNDAAWEEATRSSDNNARPRLLPPGRGEAAAFDDPSPGEFPFNREFYREFCDFEAPGTPLVARNHCPAVTFRVIP